jgi:pheromone shutdown protein TraB
MWVVVASRHSIDIVGHSVYGVTLLLQIMRAVQPHIVVLELCESRVNILQLDEKTILEEAKNINFGMKFLLSVTDCLTNSMELSPS